MRNHLKQLSIYLKVILTLSVIIVSFQNCGEPLPKSLSEQQDLSSNSPSPLQSPQVGNTKVTPQALFGTDIHLITQPSGAQVIVGERNLFLKVTALTGSGSINYQWKKDGAVLIGETGAELFFDSINLESQGNYTVVLTNGSSTIESVPAFVQVLPASTSLRAPRSSAKLSKLTLQAGEHVILKPGIVGIPYPTFQWYRDDQAISGATGEVLSLTKVTVGAGGRYSVRASNSKGTITVKILDLTVRSDNRSPNLLFGLANKTGALGQPLELTAGLDLGVPAAEIRWYKNDQELSLFKNQQRMLISSLAALDEANYRIEVSNGVGAKVTSSAKVLLSFWSDFSNSGSCSATCGGGTQMQNRTCRTSEGQVDANLCEGGAAAASRSVACNQNSCSGWGEYQNVGSCSQVCGGGVQNQTRQCLSGSSVVSNEMCEGGSAAASRVVACNTFSCGSWGSFQDSSSCSATCGGGVKTQTRQCILNGVFVGVDLCPGGASANTTVVACNTHSCDCAAASVDAGVKYNSDCYYGSGCYVYTNGNVPAKFNGDTATFNATGYMAINGQSTAGYLSSLTVTYRCQNASWVYLKTDAQTPPDDPPDNGD